MTFKSTIWYPIAVALSVINLLGLGYAVGVSEPGHAGIHGVLTLGFWLWARRLRQDPGGNEDEVSDTEARLEALEAEVSKLRQELSGTDERLDFVERLLAQGPDTRRVSPQR